KDLDRLPSLHGPVPENDRKEYGSHYRELAAAQAPVPPPKQVSAEFKAPQTGRREVIMLGSAGQRILTAGEILCLAGLSAGLRASQKNDYPITVLRGHSVSELVLSDQDIEFSGISQPCVILALAAEGVARRRSMFQDLGEKTLIILDSGVELPETGAKVMRIDFKAQKIKSHDRALASLSILARMNRVISFEMLEHAVENRFGAKVLESAMALIRRVNIKA
ncbi:MAG: 2-oxoacid:acceptor oxidoreductase family protein, partial [Deltaproteobacteria bacterium]|nr:2-oxoacid:acceptor oxidoreductase family protein [Deltaproteobacteria bacterium]